jgi:hypothetical protein
MSLIIQNKLVFDTNVLRKRIIRSLRPFVGKNINQDMKDNIKRRVLRIAAKWAEGSI